MNNTFSFARLSRLIFNELQLHKKIILLSTLTILVFLALIPVHARSTSSAYFFMLYVGGFWISASAFNPLHDPRKAFFSLTLPCSNLERFLSKWALTSVGYALGLLLFYYLLSCISFIFHTLFFGEPMHLLNIFDNDLWMGIGKYICLQSVVLLGAIIFKRHALIKTTLSLGCLFLAYSLFSGILTWMFCPDCIANHLLLSTYYAAKQTFWIVLAPICWWITYLKLTECELQ